MGSQRFFSWVLTNNHCAFFLGLNKRRLVLPLFSVGVFITGKGPSEKNLEKEKNYLLVCFEGTKKNYTNLPKKNYTLW